MTSERSGILDEGLNSMERPVTVGMLKDVPAKWDSERNWSVLCEQFDRHAADVDVFVTPECHYDGYAVTEEDWTVERFSDVTLAVDDRRIEALRDMAKSQETAIVFGFTEKLDGGFYNCALLIDAAGQIVGKYHKTHLLSHDHRFHRGNHLDTFDVDFGRVGMVICADRRWPESIRTLRLGGAEICLMPTYGMWGEENEWWMRTRSYENQMFICFTHPKVSLITNPSGKVEAKLESNVTDVLIHTIDLSQVHSGNHLENRRPDLYGPLTDTDHPSAQAPF
ncbi:MAG: carbon-nitrogen hydrolase family protein, partial [Gemmatimonadetes bacterium]|nr:carbon-nitrogen hydrolase family protein [Gemmatimonadota bacterium]